MALLNPLQVLKEPKNTAQIQKAISHHQRLKFHADINLEKVAYHDKFLSWVGSFLTAKDKYNMFCNMLRYPLKSNEVVDAIADEYMKVFKAQDSFKRIMFSDPEMESEFNDYVIKIKLKEFFENDGFKAAISAPSSLLIVDLSAEQTTDKPEPYFYLLDIESVVDVELNKDGSVSYVAFKTGANYAVFDDEYYRLYRKDNDNYILLLEELHYLGYCPAHPLWKDALKNDELVNKQSPITGVLQRLDWFLYFETSKQNLDLYAAYPITWALASKCGYIDHEGNSCNHGIINRLDVVTNKVIPIKCPACENNSLVGAGSMIEKPVPKGDNKIESGEPAGIVPVDRNSLDYNVDEVERLKNTIVASATGKHKLISKEAINEKQVESQYENQTNVLNWLARNFESAEKWLIDTICKLRHGDAYAGCEINWGTIFYLESSDDLITDYDTAKKAGLPSYMLYDKLIKIEESTTRGNSLARERLRILRCLEPYPEMSIGEAKNNGIDQIDKQGFVLKINFATFVSRFERENGSILEFGKLLPFDLKIQRINQAFEKYIQEKIGYTVDSNMGGTRQTSVSNPTAEPGNV